jgi:hypothetical protein
MSPVAWGLFAFPDCVDPNWLAYSGLTEPPVNACNDGNCCPTAAVVEAF